jgi:multidrug efflux system membrane fusion protein
VRVPVLLGLASEIGYPHEGTVDFINNQVDPSTGTLQIRGVFANPKPGVGDRVLSPGLFVRIRVPVGPAYQALLVTQSALGSDQDLKYVYILNDQNEVLRQNVTLGKEQGGLQVIAAGLKAKQRVIVNGIQRVHPGLVVNPRLVEMPGANASAGQ